MTKFIIRDSDAQLNGDKTTHVMPSGGLDIVAEDGRTLFRVSMLESGQIDVSACGCCKHENILFGDALVLSPRVSNVIRIGRVKEEQ